MFSSVESFRYAFYLVKQLSCRGDSPLAVILGCIRYNSFLVCYPTGMLAEVMVLLACANLLKSRDDYSIRMPNAANFAFDIRYFLYSLLPIYGVGFPRVYTYLLRQRRSYLQARKE
jgi:very-long-chain (3R)-3-hydroxyacyl-CoA dehydratase